jgi:cell division protein ZapD
MSITVAKHYAMISYDYPLNERVRTWLRIEDLFAKGDAFVAREDVRDHHAALQALFELVEVTTRHDLKAELLQEIERQRVSFDAWRNNPAVDGAVLAAVLAELQLTREALLATTGKPCQEIRENEWLSMMRNRCFIPGASCSFDIPTYHYWLNLPATERRTDLLGWLAVLAPIREAVTQVMRLLREGRKRTSVQAIKGLYQVNLGGRSPMLLTLVVAPDYPCVPEISAGKHAINLRFVTIDKQHRPRLCEQDIAFELML